MSVATLCKRTLLSALALLACIALFQSPAGATDKPDIAFAPGATSATVKGDVQGMDRDIYHFTAKAGQTVSVSVTNKYKLVLFHLLLPGADDKYLPKAGPEDDATTWKGALPVSGKYTILVGAMRGKDTTYTLKVEIK